MINLAVVVISVSLQVNHETAAEVVHDLDHAARQRAVFSLEESSRQLGTLSIISEAAAIRAHQRVEGLLT